MKKRRVCVIFGGRSSEHEVSLVSASSVMEALDKDKYEIIPVGITKSGRWMAGENALKLLKSGGDIQRSLAMVAPDPNENCLVAAGTTFPENFDRTVLQKSIDVVMPVLHGPMGEDGTMQGLFEMSNLPYVGANVLSSAVCMDKVMQKIVCCQAGIPAVDYFWLRYADWLDDGKSKTSADQPQLLSGISSDKIVQTIVEQLGLPVFVKPANMGSSVGITKASTQDDLYQGIEEAGKYDQKILIEAAVPQPREIEVSVLGNLYPRASVAGEIVSSNEFYDYDAKYVDDKSDLHIPAHLSAELSDKIRQAAIKSFMACDCEGLARIDFLLKRDSNEFYLNEINTLPGFTQISMYPKLWNASGLAYGNLLDELIELALERHSRKIKIQTSYQPKAGWYQS